MTLTLDIFLWVNGIIFAVLLAVLALVYSIRADLKPISDLAKTFQATLLQDWLRSRGAIGQLPKEGAKSNPLPPEKEARRRELVYRGRVYGLTEAEGAELQSILEEEARSDFSKGILNFLALTALLFAIAAFIKAVTKKG